MNLAGLAVKAIRSHYGIVDGVAVKVLGLDVLAAFLSQCSASQEAEMVRAWANEMKHRDWSGPAAMAADFRGLDLATLPVATFELASVPVLIGTLIDFPNRVVLVTGVRSAAHASVEYPSSVRNRMT